MTREGISCWPFAKICDRLRRGKFPNQRNLDLEPLVLRTVPAARKAAAAPLRLGSVVSSLTRVFEPLLLVDCITFTSKGILIYEPFYGFP